MSARGTVEETSEATAIAERLDQLSLTFIASEADAADYLEGLLDIAYDARGVSLATLYVAARPSGDLVELSEVVADVAEIIETVDAFDWANGYRVDVVDEFVDEVVESWPEWAADDSVLALVDVFVGATPVP
jgi:uncharacterized membrane protein